MAASLMSLELGIISRERAPGGPRTRYHRIVSVTGPLQLIQTFANTLGGSPATDQLGTREEAAAWLRAARLLPAEAGLSNSEHAALVRLRRVAPPQGVLRPAVRPGLLRRIRVRRGRALSRARGLAVMREQTPGPFG
jgi:hypothetical protein